MPVVTLNTRPTLRWNRSEEELRVAVETAEDARLADLLRRSQQHRDNSGRPCPTWADHVAAIQVIALRRADVAVTIRSRVLYLTAAEAAEQVLALAEDIHGVRPSDAAVAALSRIRRQDRQLY